MDLEVQVLFRERARSRFWPIFLSEEQDALLKTTSNFLLGFLEQYRNLARRLPTSYPASSSSSLLCWIN